MPQITDEKRGPESSLGLLGTLLSNPDMITRMGEIISRYTSTESSNDRDENAQSPHISDHIDNNSADIESSFPTSAPMSDTSAADLSAILPTIVHALGKGGSGLGDENASNKEQTALLLAIRPYLSENRRELIDAFLKMNKLGELIKKLA